MSDKTQIAEKVYNGLLPVETKSKAIEEKRLLSDSVGYQLAQEGRLFNGYGIGGLPTVGVSTPQYGSLMNFSRGLYEYTLGILPVFEKNALSFVEPVTTGEKAANLFGLFSGTLGSILSGNALVGAGIKSTGAAIANFSRIAKETKNVSSAAKIVTKLDEYRQNPILAKLTNQIVKGSPSASVRPIANLGRMTGGELAKLTGQLTSETVIGAHLFDMSYVESAVWSIGGHGLVRGIQGLIKNTPRNPRLHGEFASHKYQLLEDIGALTKQGSESINEAIITTAKTADRLAEPFRPGKAALGKILQGDDLSVQQARQLDPKVFGQTQQVKNLTAGLGKKFAEIEKLLKSFIDEVDSGLGKIVAGNLNKSVPVKGISKRDMNIFLSKPLRENYQAFVKAVKKSVDDISDANTSRRSGMFSPRDVQILRPSGSKVIITSENVAQYKKIVANRVNSSSYEHLDSLDKDLVIGFFNEQIDFLAGSTIKMRKTTAAGKTVRTPIPKTNLSGMEKLVDNVLEGANNYKNKFNLYLPPNATPKQVEKATRQLIKFAEKMTNKFDSDPKLLKKAKEIEDLVTKLDKLDEIGALGPTSVVNQFADSMSNLRNLILANKFLNHHGNLAIAIRGIVDDLQPLIINPKQINPLTKQKIEQINDIVGQTVFGGFDLNTLQRTVAASAKDHAANIGKHESKLRDLTLNYVKTDLDSLLKSPSQDRFILEAQRELVNIQNVPANAQASARDILARKITNQILDNDPTFRRALLGKDFRSHELHHMAEIINSKNNPHKIIKLINQADMTSARNASNTAEQAALNKIKPQPGQKVRNKKQQTSAEEEQRILEATTAKELETTTDLGTASSSLLQGMKKFINLFRSSTRMVQDTAYGGAIKFINNAESSSRLFQLDLTRGGLLDTTIAPMRTIYKQLSSQNKLVANDAIIRIEKLADDISQQNPNAQFDDLLELINPQVDQIIATLPDDVQNFVRAHKKFYDFFWDDVLVPAEKEILDSIRKGEQVNAAGRILRTQDANFALPRRIPYYYPHMRIGDLKVSYIASNNNMVTIGYVQSAEEAEKLITKVLAGKTKPRALRGIDGDLSSGRISVLEVDGALGTVDNELPEIGAALFNEVGLNSVSVSELKKAIRGGDKKFFANKFRVNNSNIKNRSDKLRNIDTNVMDVAFTYAVKQLRYKHYAKLALDANTEIAKLKNFSSPGTAGKELADFLEKKAGELFGRPYGAEKEIDAILGIIEKGIREVPGINRLFSTTNYQPGSRRLRSLVSSSLALSRISTLGINLLSAAVQTTMLPLSVLPAFGIRNAGKIAKTIANHLFRRNNSELTKALDEVGPYIGIADEGKSIATLGVRDLTEGITGLSKNAAQTIFNHVEDASLYLFNKGDRFPRRIAASMAHSTADDVYNNVVKKLAEKGHTIDSITKDEIYSIYKLRNQVGLTNLNTAEYRMLLLLKDYSSLTKFKDAAKNPRRMVERVVSGKGDQYKFKITDENLRKNFMIEIANDTNFIYSTMENPRLLNHPLLKPATQFKVFTTKYFERLFGASVRNRKEFAEMITILGLLAGPLAIPGARELLAIADLFTQGDSATANAQDFMYKTLGKFGYAGLPGMVGWDFSSRAQVGTVQSLLFQGITDDPQPFGIFAQGAMDSLNRFARAYRGDAIDTSFIQQIYPILPQAIKNVVDVVDYAKYGDLYNYNTQVGGIKMTGEEIDALSGKMFPKIGNFLRFAIGLKTTEQGRLEQILRNARIRNQILRDGERATKAKILQLYNQGNQEQAFTLAQSLGLTTEEYNRLIKSQGQFKKRTRNLDPKLKEEIRELIKEVDTRY
tara:strand:+ start:1640 stop:7111 length:5472 start_codon:yes stop_codon:yes gene_type:complete